jgi:hypothetical protein
MAGSIQRSCYVKGKEFLEQLRDGFMEPIRRIRQFAGILSLHNSVEHWTKGQVVINETRKKWRAGNMQRYRIGSQMLTIRFLQSLQTAASQLMERGPSRNTQ